MTSFLYRFADFHLDPATRVLTRGTTVIALPSKAFDVIVYLLEHRERAVGRDELIAAVWGKTDVGDNVLGQTILFARRALEDTGKEQQAIRTIVRHGYHWVAPIIVEAAAVPTAAAVDSALIPQAISVADERSRPHRGHRRTLVSVGAVVMAALILAAIAFMRLRPPPVIPPLAATARTDLLVLPAMIRGDAEASWARLGVMDLVAERLRGSGLGVVPSDNVVALVRNMDTTSWGSAEITELADRAAADLVIDAQADVRAGTWRVSLRTVHGRQPPIDTQAESLDLLAAARAAADQLAVRLGDEAAVNPIARSLQEPALQMRLQHIDAVLLSDRLDAARDLIAAAPDAERIQPELRLRLARIDYQAGDLNRAAAAFADLARDVSSEQDAVLHAHALHGLGTVAMQRNDPDAALAPLDEAVRLFEAQAMPGPLGKTLNTRAACHAARQETEAALTDLAAARVALQSAGDRLALAVLDANVGAFDLLRDRPAEAVLALDRAIEGFTTFRLHAGELNARDAAAQARLLLLEPDAALALEPRLRELAQQVADPQRRLAATLTRVEIFAANGRLREAMQILDLVRAEATAGTVTRGRVRALAAVFALDAGHAADAAIEAAAALAELPDHDDVRLAARTRLIELRAHMADRQASAAAANVTDIAAWARRVGTPASAALADLAAAEFAASGLGSAQPDEAAILFDRALTGADAARVPLDMLLVAQGYVAGLSGGHTGSQTGAVVERIARWAERDYDAALLQLRIHHVLGQTAAWRVALARSQQLAGEREIPAALQLAP